MRLRSLFLAQGGFEHEVFIPAPPEAVLAQLSQPEDWIRLQPLVIAIEPAPRHPGQLLITDKLELAGLSFRLRYRAHVLPVPGGLDAQAWSAPFVHVFNRLRCLPRRGGTVLRETSTLEAPRPLLRYTVETARAAHATLLAALGEKVMRGTPARGFVNSRSGFRPLAVDESFGNAQPPWDVMDARPERLSDLP